MADIQALNANAPLLSKIVPAYEITRWSGNSALLSRAGKNTRATILAGTWPGYLEVNEHVVEHGRQRVAVRTPGFDRRVVRVRAQVRALERPHEFAPELLRHAHDEDPAIAGALQLHRHRRRMRAARQALGAIAGALAGAHFGVEAIPAAWREALAGRDEIEELADRLLADALVGLVA